MEQKEAKPSGSQYERFVETARKLEVDEDQERFEAKLGKIAKAKPAKGDEKK